MAWTAPMTATANSVFTAAQFNTYVRDNLNETAPAKATAAGQIFVSTAANSIAARVPVTASVATTETTTSASYTDLATPGPAVTCTTGTQAIVSIRSGISDSTTQSALMSYAITGATTWSPGDDSYSLLNGGTAGMHASAMYLHTGLTAGSNTFTAKYRSVAGSTGTFNFRKIIVIPL